MALFQASHHSLLVVRIALAETVAYSLGVTATVITLGKPSLQVPVLLLSVLQQCTTTTGERRPALNSQKSGTAVTEAV